MTAAKPPSPTNSSASKAPAPKPRATATRTRPRPPASSTSRVTGAEPVGRYALRIQFSDGHNTGLYTWAYLAELAAEKTSRMAAYLGRLKDAGLSRS